VVVVTDKRCAAHGGHASKWIAAGEGNFGHWPKRLRVVGRGLRDYKERMFNFEKLDVWNEAIAFADLIYSVSRGFPDDERFGLTTQMRRAAVSISSNLAEGSSRVSRADFARFVEIATGSLFEVVSQTIIGKRQGFISENDYAAVYAAAEKQSKMLSGLRKSLAT
jgi:four helix bundle protein